MQHFWSQLRTYLNNKNINYTINFQTISLGINDISQLAHQFNFIIILAKYFVMKCKYEHREIEFEPFLNYLKYRISLEKEIATKNDKVEQHNIKWRRFNN